MPLATIMPEKLEDQWGLGLQKRKTRSSSLV